jgi:hypothetical protein
MSDQSNSQNTANSGNGGSQERSTADNIRELTQASKQLFEAGKQLTDNLSELSERVEHASEMGSNILTSPWLVAGAAIAAGVLLVVFARRR